MSEKGGRDGSERGTSQYSESSRRKDAEEQVGNQVRGKAESQKAESQTADEASTRSQDTARDDA